MAETSLSLAAQIRALQVRMTTLTAAMQEHGFDRRGYHELDDQREDRVELRERLTPARQDEPQRDHSRGMEY